MLSTLAQQALRASPEFSDLPVIIISTLVIAYIVYRIIIRLSSAKPPRPSPHQIATLPIVGSIPFLPKYGKLHHFFFERRNKGPVLGFKTLSQYNIVLQTREAIEEALCKPEISTHSNAAFGFVIPEYQRKGVIFMMPYNAEFKKFHQLTSAVMKQFGFGDQNGLIETRSHEDVARLVSDLREFKGRPVNPARHVEVGVLNIMTGIMFGLRHEKEDAFVVDLLHNVHEILDGAFSILPVVLLPVFRFIPYYKRSIERMRKAHPLLMEILGKKIAESERNQAETHCFIRAYRAAAGNQAYDRLELCNLLLSLLLAGTQGTSVSLMWFIAVLANNPDVQSRLQTEIDSVVPQGRLPSLSDRPQLKFVEATILELMRYRTPAPLGLAHVTSKDTVVQGFSIPANTVVLSNFHSVHMDPNIWGDPEKFRPDRFITPEGNIINKDKTLPFSCGKRSCIGKKIAVESMFLFFTGLMQSFTILPPDGCAAIDCSENLVDGSLSPAAFEVRFIQRTNRPSSG